MDQPNSQPNPAEHNFVERGRQAAAAIAAAGLGFVGLGVAPAEAMPLKQPAPAVAEPASYETERSMEAASTVSFERFAGEDRIETANLISQANNPDGTYRSVLVANGYTSIDALAAGPLAAAFKSSILLSGKDSVDPRTIQEALRATANYTEGQPRIALLGGTAAIGDNVRREFEKAGFFVSRIEGENRFATAAEMGRRAFGSTTQSIMLASGIEENGSYADALIAGVAGATSDRIGGIPTGRSEVLLTNGNKMPPETLARIQEVQRFNPGVKIITVGDGASDAYPNAAKAIRGGSAPSRSLRLTTEVAPGPNRGEVGFVTVGPDALTAAPHMAQRGGILVIEGKQPLEGPTKTYITSLNLRNTVIYGGTDAISDNPTTQDIHQAAAA